MGIKEDASRIHEMGYNCAQCVLCSCTKYTGLDEGISIAISSGFGGGLRSGEICGAISGAVMALGKKKKKNDPSDPSARQKASSFARECVSSFRDQYGFVRCLDLKKAGISCDELIQYGAQYVEDKLKSE